MKKILSALMLCLVSIMTFGQIQVQQAPQHRDVVRAMGFNFSVTIVESKSEEGTFYFLRTATTNQFDKTFLLPIGTTEEEVLASLASLHQMTSAAKGTSFQIDENYHASVVAKGTIYIKGVGYAGCAEITKKQVEKLQTYYANGGH